MKNQKTKLLEMNDFCLLDNTQRDEFIDKHIDEYIKHHGEKKAHKSHMKSHTGDNTIRSELYAIKERLTDDSLSLEEQQELRQEFFEKTKALQLSWVKPR